MPTIHNNLIPVGDQIMEGASFRKGLFRLGTGELDVDFGKRVVVLPTAITYFRM